MLKTPPCREGQPDWLHSVACIFNQLKRIKQHYRCPLLVAGDIFDHWKPSPELINFALKYLPRCYAVPGQHDLPFHNYSAIEKTGYWTLVESGIITNVAPNQPIELKQCTVHGFPWGTSVKNYKIKNNGINIALVHQYIWNRNNKYPTAPSKDHVAKLTHSIQQFDFGVFGDNHKGFVDNANRTPIINCGSLIRIKSDQINYKPFVTLLLNDLTVVPIRLDLSNEIIVTTISKKTKQTDLQQFQQFAKTLGLLKEHNLDFKQAVKTYTQNTKTNKNVQKILNEAIKEASENE